LIRAQDLELEGELAEPRCGLSLENAREQAERDLIQQTLRETRHNMSECARRLGVSRVTLYRLCKKLRLALGEAV
jgi:DNA-binding NtrC family response regulator